MATRDQPGQAKLYSRYTSTCSLSGRVDPNELIEWSRGAFEAHIGPLLPPDRRAAILEIGCGYGRGLTALADLGYVNCEGVDISDEQVRYARAAFGLQNAHRADCRSWLASRAGQYDCILAIDLLEHLPLEELLEVVEACHGALRPGGTFVAQVPNGVAIANPVVFGDLTHVRAFTVQSMDQLLLSAGFGDRQYREAGPYVHGVPSAVRRVLWTVLVRPLLAGLMLLLYGETAGGIYSANFIAVARRTTGPT